MDERAKIEGGNNNSPQEKAAFEEAQCPKPSALIHGRRRRSWGPGASATDDLCEHGLEESGIKVCFFVALGSPN